MANLNNLGAGRNFLKKVLELNGSKGKHLTSLLSTEKLKEKKNSYSPVTSPTKK